MSKPEATTKFSNVLKKQSNSREGETVISLRDVILSALHNHPFQIPVADSSQPHF